MAFASAFVVARNGREEPTAQAADGSKPRLAVLPAAEATAWIGRLGKAAPIPALRHRHVSAPSSATVSSSGAITTTEAASTSANVSAGSGSTGTATGSSSASGTTSTPKSSADTGNGTVKKTPTADDVSSGGNSLGG